MMKNLLRILIIAVFSFAGFEMYAAKGQDTSKNIENVATPSVTSGIGNITIYNPIEDTQFTIYSIIGQVVKTFTMQVGTATVELPKGFYIIKCNLWSRKIVVK